MATWMRSPSNHSLFTHFRARMGTEILVEVNDWIAQEGLKAEQEVAAEAKEEAPEDQDDDDPEGGQLVMDIGDSLTVPEVEEGPAKVERKQKKSPPPSTAPDANSNRGTLMLDATCAPADIKHPTDLNSLNHTREILETIIDTVHQPLVGTMDKPRTYRKQARKDFLNVSKQRQLKGKTIRKAMKKQLGYVGRDLRIIERLIQHTPLTLLKKSLYRHLLCALNSPMFAPSFAAKPEPL